MSLKLLSLNVHKGKNWRGQSYPAAMIRNLLSIHHVDAALLQEVALYENKDLMHGGDHLRGHGFPHFIYGGNVSGRGGGHGNAMMSTSRVQFDFDKNEDVSSHFLERRGVLSAKASCEGFGVGHVFCCHFALTGAGRRYQAEKVLEMAAAVSDSDWILIGGDFNDWRGSLDNVFAKEGFVNALRHDGRKAPKTFPSPAPLVSLDRFYFKSGEFVVSDGGAINSPEWAAVSDHLPVWLSIAKRKV